VPGETLYPAFCDVENSFDGRDEGTVVVGGVLSNSLGAANRIRIRLVAGRRRRKEMGIR